MSPFEAALGLVFDPYVLLVLLLAAIFGLVVGALPGLTATMATALLVPITFFMDPVPAIGAIVTAVAMAIFAGDISGTLLRIPGTPASAAYVEDAYRLTRQGQAELALGVCLTTSAIGGLFGTAVLAFSAPALAEFARHGLGGARVDRIAARAGANKRMLYYYFGNKDALFLAVLKDSYARIRSAERALHLADLDPREAMRRLVEFTWRYYLQHPEFLTLLNSENLHRGRHVKRSRDIVAMHAPFVAMIQQVLARGARSGEFRRGVDPVQLYISIAGLGYFYLSNRHTLSTIFERDLLARRHKAERLRHMEALVLGYLRK